MARSTLHRDSPAIVGDWCTVEVFGREIPLRLTVREENGRRWEHNENWTCIEYVNGVGEVRYELTLRCCGIKASGYGAAPEHAAEEIETDLRPLRDLLGGDFELVRR